MATNNDANLSKEFSFTSNFDLLLGVVYQAKETEDEKYEIKWTVGKNVYRGVCPKKMLQKKFHCGEYSMYS